MKHQQSQAQVTALKVGDTVRVESGAGTVTILAKGPVQRASDSSYAGMYVIHTTGDHFTPFATHTLYFDDDSDPGRWLMLGGNSHVNLTMALRDFKGRTGEDA